MVNGEHIRLTSHVSRFTSHVSRLTSHVSRLTHHAYMFIIDQIAYTNKLKNVHPMEKFCFAILTLLVALMSRENMPLLMIILMMCSVLIFRAGVSPGKLLSLLSCPFAFLSLGVIGIIVSITNSANGSLLALPAGNYWLIITKENLYEGIYLTLRALASVCCLYFLALTTPMTEIMSILKKLGVPGILREMISLIYRSIFILIEMANYIHLSQDSRLGYSNFRRSYYSLSQLISCIFLKSCNHAGQMHKALMSRGYEGDINVLEGEYKISAKNWVIIFTVEIILLAVIFGGKILG